MKKLLYKYSRLGTTPELSTIQQKRIIILNLSALLAALYLLIHLFYNIASEHDVLSIIVDIFLILFFFSVSVFNHFKKYNVSFFFMFALFPLLLLGTTYMYGDVAADNFIFPIMILIFFSIDNKKVVFAYAIFDSVVYITSHILISADLTLNTFPELITAYYYFNISGVLVTLILVSNIYSVQNTNQLKQLNTKNSSLNEKNKYIKSLLQELNHRVKNNLQITASLLRLQARKTENIAAKNILISAQNRITSIAIVHKTLYSNKLIFNLPVREYIEELIQYLLTTGNDEIDADFKIDEFETAIEDAVNIGLILSELFTNTIKHANVEKFKITLALTKIRKNEISIKYSDTGVGFPDNFTGKKTFGFFLLDIIVHKYNGTYKTYNKNGANIEITLNLNTD